MWECPLLVKLPVQPGGCPALDQATAAAGAAPPADGTGTSSGTDGGGNVTSCASAAGQHCAAGTASSPAKAAATAATSNPPAAVTPHGGATTSSPADDAPQRADAAGTRTADPAGAGAVAGSESGAASSSAATDKSAAALSSPTLMVRSPSLASSPSSSNSSSTSREDAAVAALHAAPAAGPAGLSREGVSPTSHPTITAALGSAAPHVDAAHLFFFCVSPDVPTNPALYWLGNYDGGTKQFDLASSLGPYRLDLGDVLYAPNVLRDGGGRLLLWGWLQVRHPSRV